MHVITIYEKRAYEFERVKEIYGRVFEGRKRGML